MSKLTSAKQPDEITADWFDINAPSDDLIVLGDGDPGFKVAIDTERLKKLLQEKKQQ